MVQQSKKIILLCLILLCTGFSYQSSNTVKWLALGDSITYLNDHVNETGNRVQKGYLTRTKEKLPYLQYINKGYNGWTASRIAEKIDELGLEKADLYTVFLGTNDWWHGGEIGTIDDYSNNTGFKTLYGAFRIIIDKLHKLNPDAPIILMTPLQRGDFIYVSGHGNNAYGSYKNNRNGQSLAAFADAIEEIGIHANIAVIDLYNDSGITVKNVVKYKRLKNPEGKYKNYKYPAYTDIPFSPDDEYPYPLASVNMTYDGLHPSDKGCARIAAMLSKKIKLLIR